MPRPKKERLIESPPRWQRFKPVGVISRQLQHIDLLLDEFEAMRLSDHLGMDHLRASRYMGISRSTFTRLIEQAHKKMAQFVLNGGELQLTGGNVQFRENLYQCGDCGLFLRTSADTPLLECPECGSARLIDYAAKYNAPNGKSRD